MNKQKLKYAIIPLCFITPVLAVTLTWDANPDPVDGYKLHWGPESGSPSQHRDVGNVTENTVDNGELPMGSTIHFTATAYNPFGESGPSNEVAYAVPIATSGVEFIKIDQSTQGNWKGTYGENGYAVIGDVINYPADTAVIPSGHKGHTWAWTTLDGRALQKANHETERIAACWYQTTSFTIEMVIAEGVQREIAIYCLDWDKRGRVQNIRIVDAETDAVLDTRDISAFQSGQYLVYKVRGHFKIIFTKLAGPNAVIGGIFF